MPRHVAIMTAILEDLGDGRTKVVTTSLTASAFGQQRTEIGVRPSSGTVGDTYDNALDESFFATLECELLDRRRFRTHTEFRIWTRTLRRKRPPLR
jgi:hypothetical protein